MLTDIVYIELPEGDVVATWASSRSSNPSNPLPIFAPLAGTITAVNVDLEDAPELMNSSPYGDGWIVKMTLDNPAPFPADGRRRLQSRNWRVSPLSDTRPTTLTGPVWETKTSMLRRLPVGAGGRGWRPARKGRASSITKKPGRSSPIQAPMNIGRSGLNNRLIERFCSGLRRRSSKAGRAGRDRADSTHAATWPAACGRPRPTGNWWRTFRRSGPKSPPRPLSWSHVKAHRGHRWNERADYPQGHASENFPALTFWKLGHAIPGRRRSHRAKGSARSSRRSAWSTWA